MNSVLLSRIDWTALYPPFFERISALVKQGQAEGADFYAISAQRDYAEQTKLYAQGRTAPGPVVTWAKAGESAHNFGLAVDFCRDGVVDRKGLQPDWRNESYEPLRALAPKHGLVWGGIWTKPDRPHVQWPGYVTSAQLEPLRKIYEAAGITAVWAFLDNEGTNA